MVKLKRLRIVKYRNVTPGTELSFNDGINVLLGQNGTGKTTLLNLMAMICRQDLSALREEIFEIEYDLASPSWSISALIQNSARNGVATGGQRPYIPREHITVATSTNEASDWSFRVDVSFAGFPAHFTLRSNPVAATVEERAKPGDQWPVAVISPFQSRFISLMLASSIKLLDERAPKVEDFEIHLVQRLAVQNYNGGRFDESLVTFNAMTGEPGLKLLQAPDVSLMEFYIRRPDGICTSVSPTYTPLDIMVDLMDDVRLSADDDIVIGHDKYEFMSKVVKLLRLQSAEIRVTRLKKEVRDQDDVLSFGKYRFFFTEQDGTTFTHDYLSYGQKRLLAFFYYLAANESIAIADELVNGMHHEWIEACLDALGDHQAFLTSQNPLLLDYLSFDSAEQATKTFVLCSTKVVDGRKHLVWQNMPEADAAEFFAAYEVGIQHVSAILRTKGLW